MVQLTQRDGVHVLSLGDDENRFSPDTLTAIEDALDRVEASPAPLVTTAVGKFWSNGLDLDWLSANAEQFTAYVARVQRLLARVLTLPVPTLAAVSGHAFGAGAMLATAHDQRLMRVDRGFYCFPEVDIHIPFSPGMAALIQAKLGPQTANAAMTTGRRYPGPEAEEAGLVDGTATESDLLAHAVARMLPLIGKDPTTLAAIKTTMYADVTERLLS